MKRWILAIPLALLLTASTAMAECIDARPIIYPYPQESCLGEMVELGATFNTVDVGAIGPRETIRYKEYFNFIGIKEDEGADMLVTFSSMAPEHREILPGRQEGYTIAVDPGPPLSIQIGARTDVGFYYAFQTLKQMIADGKIYTGTVKDWPNFPARGILEGGYGVWLFEDRIRVLQTLGPLKMNYFIYGPKEGKKYRRRWRGLYDEWELREFMIYKKICEDSHVIFAFAINPALNMIYSDPVEFDRLVAKARQVQQLGVSNFSVFFDDIIPPQLGLGDADVYADPASAHIDVTNRLYDELKKYDPDVQMSFVPVPYWETLPVMYNKRIAEDLNPAIKIGWTGRGIVSDTITKQDVQDFIDLFGQPPALGDNWSNMTVNNRALDLWENTDIFINNPYGYGFKMRDSDRSKTQIQWFVNATLADYAWNSPAYDPETSLREACRVIAGPVGGPLLKAAVEVDQRERHQLGYKSELKKMVEELGTLSGDAFEQKKEALRQYLENIKASQNQALKDIKDPHVHDHFNEIFDNANKRIREALWLLKAGPEDPAELALALGKEVGR